MTLQVCCGPGVAHRATLFAQRAFLWQPIWLLMGSRQRSRREPSLNEGGSERRNWLCVLRGYYGQVMQTKMPFVGQAPHACRFKAGNTRPPLFVPARELSGAAARPANAVLSRRASRRRRASLAEVSQASRGTAEFPEEPPSSQRRRRAPRAAELARLLESSPPCFVVQVPPCTFA